MKSDMMDATVFRMIEIGGELRGSNSNEEGVAVLSAIWGNVREDRIVDDGCCTLTKD